MPFVPAKCTQCGSNIQVDDSKELGICASCGTPFITERVINNYVTNNVVTQTFSTVNNIAGGEIHIHQSGESADNAYATLVGLIARGKIFDSEKDNEIFFAKWEAFGKKYPLDPRCKELDALCWIAAVKHGESGFVSNEEMLESLEELKQIDKATYEKCEKEAVKAINAKIAKTAGRKFKGNMLDVKMLLGDVSGLLEQDEKYCRYKRDLAEYNAEMKSYQRSLSEYNSRKSSFDYGSSSYSDYCSLVCSAPSEPIRPIGYDPYTTEFWKKIEKATGLVNAAAFPADEEYADCVASVMSELWVDSSHSKDGRFEKLLEACCRILQKDKKAYLEPAIRANNNKKRQAVTIVNRTKYDISYYKVEDDGQKTEICIVGKGDTKTERQLAYGDKYQIIAKNLGDVFFKGGKIGTGEPIVYEITQKLFKKFVVVEKNQGKKTVSKIKVQK